jgi:hypothetical protein
MSPSRHVSGLHQRKTSVRPLSTGGIVPPGAITLSPPVIGYYLPPESVKTNEETLWSARCQEVWLFSSAFLCLAFYVILCSTPEVPHTPFLLPICLRYPDKTLNSSKQRIFFVVVRNECWFSIDSRQQYSQLLVNGTGVSLYKREKLHSSTKPQTAMHRNQTGKGDGHD